MGEQHGVSSVLEESSQYIDLDEFTQVFCVAFRLLCLAIYSDNSPFVCSVHLPFPLRERSLFMDMGARAEIYMW